MPPDNTLLTNACRMRRILPLLVLLFAASGCAALIYEVVWFQLLQLVIGSSAVSLGVLLGTYMGGMCLGSLLLPRVVSRRAHPVRVYAWIELGIGACGLLVLFGAPHLNDVYPWIANAVGAGGLGGILLRGAIAALCLVPPTLLMGASLPAIARWIEARPEGVAWLGFFYGGNIAGAVVGAVVAGFYLLRLYDMAIGTYAAVGINVVVGVAALLLAELMKGNARRRTEHAKSLHFRRTIPSPLPGRTGSPGGPFTSPSRFRGCARWGRKLSGRGKYR